MALRLNSGDHSEAFVGDPSSAIAALEQRLGELQLAQIVHRQRAIIIIEGWEGAGRTTTLRRIAGAMDPGHVATHATRSGASDRDGNHWLARFWGCLPTASRTVIFDGSWYRLLAERRASGELDDRALSRACDEINEFEAQQRDHGTLIVKLFLHVSAETHLERLRVAEADPWRRWLLDPTEAADIERRSEHIAAWEAMFAQTDTRWSPWQVISAHDHRAAQLAALGAVAGALEKVVPDRPPGSVDKVVHFPRQMVV